MEEPGERRILTAFRLANTMHSEIAQSLPLPSLPVSFGAGSQEISSFNRDKAITSAEKIAELLGSTDVSYVTLKDKSREMHVAPEPGSLESAVLSARGDAFDCEVPGKHEAAGNKLPPAIHLIASNTEDLPKVATPSSVDEQVPARVKKKPRLKRRSHQEKPPAEQCPPLDNGIAVGLRGLLHEFLDRTEAQGDTEEDGPILSLQDIRSFTEEITALHSKCALNKVPPEQLVRLLELLDRHIRQAHLKEIDESDDVESENFEIVMTALESTQTMLMIMSSRYMPKQIYKEESIDRLIEFTRYQIVHSVFTAYDPMYRQLHKTAGAEEDEGDDEEEDNDANHGKKARRRSRSGRTKKAALSKISTAVSAVLHKLCTILDLLKDLLSVERLADSTILQLMKTVLGTFGVDNIQLLHLKAIGVACTVFSLYPHHRLLITDEVLTMLWKIPLSKRNLRTYHLPDEEPKQIQMLTALLLHLVQCSVSLPELTNSEASDPTKCIDPAVNICNHFWGSVLQRWSIPKTQEGADSKAVVENVVLDLLSTLNLPEFPASSLVLQILCVLLLGGAGVKSKDVAVRVNAIELLGQIAAHLKRDAVICSRDKLWILQELNEDNAREPQKDECTVCGSLKGNNFTLRCDGCKRWFHGDCVGITGQDLLGRGWLCHSCLCKKQLASFTFGKDKSSNLKVPKGGLVVVQQILLNFLQESGGQDSLLLSTCSFYLCLWYRYDSQGAASLPFYHWRYNSRIPAHDFGVNPSPLFRNTIIRITRALGQRRPLARGFDRILERLLATLQESASNPRAKALKAVSGIVEVDPEILADERVQKAVEGRFLDSAISVREAAMELVGRHIVSRPDVAIKYFDRLSERILDTGVSVRKRVIKIIRDFCLTKGGFSKATEACIRVISRVNDDEASIQDLVCKTFYEMWFEEQTGQQSHFVADGSVVPLEVAERAQQLVDVLKSLPSHQPVVLIIKRSLALDFIPQGSKVAAPSVISQAAVRNRCELMCTYLLECILKAEEMSEDCEVQALPYVSALHAFCTVDPTLCAPSADPSRFAVTLEPYLKTQADNRDTAQLLQSIVYVIDMVLPLVRRPPQSFVEDLERDLGHLVLRYPFLNVVHACIKCLSSLTKISPKGMTQFSALLRHFFKVLQSPHKSAQEKPGILRALFCLGLFVRYGAEFIDTFDEPDLTMEVIMNLYKEYLRSEDFELKSRASQATGFVFLARPQCMMEEDIQKILQDSLSSGFDTRVKIHTLRNFYDYLLDVEKQMGADNKEEKPASANAVPIAAGAGDNNICGGIIQFHWDRILERCLDLDDQVRQAALKLVEVVLRQGLVHPMTCVPQLIALEVDRVEANAKLAHRLLTHLNEKYPAFFESRLGDGLQMSFLFIQSGVDRQNNQKEAAVARGGISRIYKLIKGVRNSRNKFIASVVRKFDWVASGQSSIPFLTYCTEILTSLPFTLVEEPLYLIFAINRVLQVRAGDLEASLKAEFSEEPLHSYAKTHGGDSSAGDTDMAIDVPEGLFRKLQAQSEAAVSLSLLLKMKRYLKISYALDDARCQAFQPSDCNTKSSEPLSRQVVKEFSCDDLLLQQARSIREVLQRYQVFKSLLKDDTMDYASYASPLTSKKRGRHSGVQPDGFYQGHGQAGSKMRRKSAPLAAQDNSDHEHEGDGDGDEDYGGPSKRRRSGASSASKRRRPVQPILAVL